MKTYARELTLFFTLLLACPSGHAAEQDNWYLANEWRVSTARDIAYYEDKTSGTDKEIYPFLYQNAQGGWLYFYGQHKGTLLLYDYEAKRWISKQDSQ